MKPEEDMDEIEIWDGENKQPVVLRFRHGSTINYNGTWITGVRQSNADVGFGTVEKRRVHSPKDYTSFSEDARKAGIKGNIYAEQEKPFWKFW